MTIAIAFNGGTYGTYLEWCLTTLSSTSQVIPPFTSVGNSHMFRGNHLLNIDGWKKFINSSNDAQFVRFHPKTMPHESLSSNMNYVCNSADSVIYIYPDQDSILLSLNNFTYKIWKDWWQHSFDTEINVNKIYNNWPVSKDVSLDNIPKWIKREFLSLYLIPAWFAQVEWYHPSSWHHPKCCVITVKQLLYEFEYSIMRIKSHCNLEFEKSIDDLLTLHQENLRLQKYTNQDSICKEIIAAVVDNQPLDWENITLTSEAWVQWELRNLGYEIKCHGLDTFPTNSVQLKELLYTV